MADIKQAAKWMQKGKKVTRKGEDFYFRIYGDGEIISGEDNYPSAIFVDDLLAQDWEIYPE